MTLPAPCVKIIIEKRRQKKTFTAVQDLPDIRPDSQKSQAAPLTFHAGALGTCSSDGRIQAAKWALRPLVSSRVGEIAGCSETQLPGPGNQRLIFWGHDLKWAKSQRTKGQKVGFGAKPKGNPTKCSKQLRIPTDLLTGIRPKQVQHRLLLRCLWMSLNAKARSDGSTNNARLQSPFCVTCRVLCVCVSGVPSVFAVCVLFVLVLFFWATTIIPTDIRDPPQQRTFDYGRSHSPR